MTRGRVSTCGLGLVVLLVNVWVFAPQHFWSGVALSALTVWAYIVGFGRGWYISRRAILGNVEGLAQVLRQHELPLTIVDASDLPAVLFDKHDLQRRRRQS